jgi:RNA recognition motif-containing protein
MEKKLFVGNLSYTITEGELKELFGEHGTVEGVKILQGRGFGFIEMSTSDEARSAREALNLKFFGGRSINVNEAKPMVKKDGFGGGFSNRY